MYANFTVYFFMQIEVEEYNDSETIKDVILERL